MRGWARLLSDILAAAPGVRILVTSRARLNLQAEQLYPISGMDVPPLLSEHPPRSAGGNEGGNNAGGDAVQLFLWGARRINPDIEPTADEYSAISQICCLVEGMPLAILLAASWARMLTPAEIATQLAGTVTDTADGPLDFLETDWGDVPARQRSMRAVFDHSWNLLTKREQDVLAASSVFHGGFTHEAAHQVAGASLHDLATLVDRSLLHRTQGRYGMHELLHQYAADRLCRATEPIHERHSAYYARKLQAWAADLKSGRQVAALEEMETEIANARTAWNWMVSQVDIVQLDLALEGLCLFYEWRGRYQEGQSVCQIAVHALSQEVKCSTPVVDQERGIGAINRVLAKVLTWQGVFSGAERARKLFQESLVQLRDAESAGQDTDREKAFTLLKMGGLGEGDVPSLEQSLALYRQLDDDWRTAQALESLAWFAWNAGSYAEMERLYKESLSIYQALGDRRGIAASSQWLGIALLYQGRLTGERLVRDGIAIYEEIGDRAHIAHGLVAAGLGLLSLGRFAETHALLEQSVAVYSDLGISAPFADMLLGGAKVHLGQYEQGRIWGQTVLDTTRQLDRSTVGFPLLVLGWVALSRESYAEAQRLFQEGVDACQNVEQQELLSWVLAFLGYADRGLGQFEQARIHLHWALQVAADIPSFIGLTFALPGVALLLADLGYKVRALELYALASRYPVVANSRWFVDAAARPLATMVATLPANVIAAAEERGRALDLEATVVELLAELSEGCSL